jgi:hypothetical protein
MDIINFSNNPQHGNGTYVNLSNSQDLIIIIMSKFWMFHLYDLLDNFQQLVSCP